MDSIIGVIIAFAVYVAFKLFKGEEKESNAERVPQKIQDWNSLAVEASQKYGVPYRYVMATIWQESGGNRNAVGSAGEKGLMQLKQIAVTDVEQMNMGEYPNYEYDAKENIFAGTAYLALQYKRTGDWQKAIEAYNQGYAGRKVNRDKAIKYRKEVMEKAKFFA